VSKYTVIEQALYQKAITKLDADINNILEDMNESIKKFEQDLNLPKNFIDSLLAEDDWTFIIKLSALLEAATSNVLTAILHKNLEDVFSYLDYANPKYGKIAFLEKLNILTQEQANVLKKFAELRNQIVHKVANTNFTFDTYLKDISHKEQLKAFEKWAGHGIKETTSYRSKSFTKKEVVQKYPKMSIFFTIRAIIACMYSDKELEDIKKQLTYTLTPSSIEKVTQKGRT